MRGGRGRGVRGVRGRGGRGAPMIRGRGMRMGGMGNDRGLLRTMANKKEQTYATRRLLKDLKEIETNKVPTVGVTARPQGDNLFIWHANLRGPEGTLYQGGVFHCTMVFPPSYPHQPPEVTMCTPIPHPCMQGNKICLDMLDTTRRGLYEGWTSGYSVLSILVQLQSFLFEQPDETKEMRKRIKEAVRRANEFSMLEVGHKGPLSPWPPFHNKEADLTSFVMVKSEKEIIENELVCFHTKLLSTETPLGIGVSITRLPRTGEIKSVDPTLDLISLKAYMKEGVRNSLDNASFTHWMPIYFGVEKERTIYLARKSLSMICTGSTKRFEEKFVLMVMPKILLTLILNMMQQKDFTSLKALRTLALFHRLFILLLEEYKDLYAEVDQILANFMKEEKYRVKDNLSSLGDMLSLMTVSKTVTWKDIIPVYLSEQMDRQVFWMLKEIPDLEKAEEKGEELIMDEDRDHISFQTGKVGFFITMFYGFFIGRVCKPEGKTLNDLVTYYDEYFGRLPRTLETAMQEECVKIRTVKDFSGYFRVLGIPLPNKEALVLALKKAVKNSRIKKYHGAEEEFSALPEREVMIRDIMKSYKDMEDYIDPKSKKLLDEKDPIWEKACIQKFIWINDIYKTTKPKVFPLPCELAKLSDLKKMSMKLPEDRRNFKKEVYYGEVATIDRVTVFEEYPQTMSWRNLFLKLDFEYFMMVFPYNPDFKKFYRLIEQIKPLVTAVCLPIISKASLKSGYYWLTAFLSRMPQLECLKLYTPCAGDSGSLSLDAMRYLYKGLNNFKENGGKMLKFQIVRPNSSIEEKIMYSLKCLPELRVLRFRHMRLSKVVAQAINRILTDFKFIQELDLKDCQLDIAQVKEVADGLMRAKQLEVLKLARNPGIAGAVYTVVYNLAFSPKIRYLDLSDINFSNGGRMTDNQEAIVKLLSITGSLETLNLSNTYINSSLKEDFYKALGENKTLRVLMLDGSGLNNVSNMGKAIALNHKKNGSLCIMSLQGALSGSGNARSFWDALWVSDYDHEVWYGDPVEAAKMFGNQRERKFQCGLTQVHFGNINLGSNFSLASTKRYTIIEQYPPIIRALCFGKITNLSLPRANLTSKDGDLLSLCIKNKFQASKLLILNLEKNGLRKEGAKALAGVLNDAKIPLQCLNLSGNQIGVSGCQALSKALKINMGLKSLDLFSNIVDVDGARALKEALVVNNTIQSLDLGLNRLRDKGAMAIADGLFGNKNSALTKLGLRFNFISDDGFLEFFKKAVFAPNSKLEHLYIQHNYMTELTSTQLETKIGETRNHIFIDEFIKYRYLKTELLARSIWISPLWIQDGIESHIKQFFEVDKKCGIVTDVRVRTGTKVEGKPGANVYGIVEFAHPNSVLKALRVASKKKAFILGKRIRIYKAGTSSQKNKPPKKRW